MLRDKTNNVVIKTFARKPKAAPPEDDASSCSQPAISAAQQEQASPAAVSPANSSLGSLGSQATHDAALQPAQSNKEYSWLGLRGRQRRSSVLVTRQHLSGGPGGLVNLAQHQADAVQRAKAAAQRRVVTIHDIVQQLVDYYLEVDAEELIEESPDKATHKSSSRSKSRQATAQEQHKEGQAKALPGRLRFSSLLPVLASPIMEEEPEEADEARAALAQPGTPALEPQDQQEEEGEEEDGHEVHVRAASKQVAESVDADATSAALEKLTLHGQGAGGLEGQTAAAAAPPSPGSRTSRVTRRSSRHSSQQPPAPAATSALQRASPTQDDVHRQEQAAGQQHQALLASPDSSCTGSADLQQEEDGGEDVTGGLGREADTAQPHASPVSSAAQQSARAASRLSLPPPPPPAAAASRPARRGSTNSSDVLIGGSQPGLALPASRRSSAHRRSSVTLISVQEDAVEAAGTGAGVVATAAGGGQEMGGNRRHTGDGRTEVGLTQATSGRRTRSSIRISIMPTTLLAPLEEEQEEEEEEEQEAGGQVQDSNWAERREEEEAQGMQEVVPLELLRASSDSEGSVDDAQVEGLKAQGPAGMWAADEGSHADGGELDEQQPVEEEQQLSALQQLLKICGQDVDEGSIPDMTTVLSTFVEVRKVVKVGEGTYGEAFKYGTTVFKVIPLEGQQLVNGCVQKKAGEVAAEALMALTLSQLREKQQGLKGGGAAQQAQAQVHMTNGFVETHQVGVCRGPYPPALIKAWHKWDKSHGSENDPVDELTEPGQLFLVLAMGDCGRDLEKAQVPGFDQAKAVLAQVCFALAVAESALEFEHRDLHWGNVMLRTTTQPWLPCRLAGVDLQLASHGLHVSLIDFTASRLRTAAGLVAFCDLSQDEELFQGPAKHTQFDTYRWMRQLTGDDWQRPCLATNCLWLSYLADILLVEKGQGYSSGHKRLLREFRKRAAQVGSCTQLVDDPLFDGLWKPLST